MKPGITVLMPVYNAAAFLQEAIDSILQQTYANFEFLIIDDGSTDSSAAIVLSNKDSRIRFIRSEQNAGVTPTLNKGIDLATAELIARMDADDISYPDRLQKQLNYFKAHPDCALLSSWAREITSTKENIWSETLNPAFYYYHLAFECWIYHPTVMYRKSVVQDVGKYTASFAEDFSLWCKIVKKYKMHNLPEVLLDYRCTANSISRVSRKKEYEVAHLEQLYKNVNFYTRNSCTLNQQEAEFLRLNFDPILQDYSISKLKTCFKKLDHISKCIEATNNVNRNITDIRKAAAFKRMQSIKMISQFISRKELIRLLIRLQYWKELYLLMKNKRL